MQENKQSHLRSTSTLKNVRFNNDLLAQINLARGDKPFGTWVQELCKKEVRAK